MVGLQFFNEKMDCSISAIISLFLTNSTSIVGEIFTI